MRKQFIDEWCENPPLKRAVLLDLLKKSKGGDVHARNKVIEHSGRLLAKLLKKYEIYDDCMTKDELYSSALDGLITAINRFDPEKGSFSTIATLSMRTYVSRAIHQRRSIVKIPDYQRCVLSKAKLNFEIGDRVDDSATNILNMSNTITVDNLDDVCGHHRGNDETFDRVNRKLMLEAIKCEIDRLDPQSGEAVRRRYGLFDNNPETVYEFCKTMKKLDGSIGVTPAWATMLLNKGISKLKKSEKLRELAMQL